MSYSGTVQFSYIGTAGGTADTVNFSGNPVHHVTVTNRGAADIYVRPIGGSYGTGTATATNESYVVPLVAAGASSVKDLRFRSAVTALSVIAASGSPIYAVEVFGL